MKVKLSLVGGFLGAGKTSIIAALAKRLGVMGERVAVITNDQGKDLIDTRTMLAGQIEVAEITGGCFCCRFDELEQVIARVMREVRSTWILAESVGSCTDLVATVMRPLLQFHSESIQLTPMTIVIDPHMALDVFRRNGVKVAEVMGVKDGVDVPTNLSPLASLSKIPESSSDVDYLYMQQIQEADIILINKSDIADESVQRKVEAEIQAIHPNAKTMYTSAVTGVGLSDWGEVLVSGTTSIAQSPLLHLDYHRYAVAEAQLGWVNMTFNWSSHQLFELDSLVLRIGEDLHRALVAHQADVAHVKMMGLSSAGHVNGSLTKTDGLWQWKGKVMNRVDTATVVVNARVRFDPAELSQLVLASIRMVCEPHGVQVEVLTQEAFRPSPPVPVHRMA